MNSRISFTTNLYSDDRFYLKPNQLFYLLFNEICSIYTYHKCKVSNELHDALRFRYGKNSVFRKFVDFDNFVLTGRTYQREYYVLDKELILLIANEGIGIYYKHGEENPKLDELKEILVSHFITEQNTLPKFYMIFDEYGYLELREYKLKQVSTDISTHYNDSFGKINGKIGDFLENEKSGLVMLYGKSGTGKTSYVRYLINKFDRKFIYLPAEMVGGLSRPMFLPFLAENPNSIYIIEDCEELLMQRTKGANTNNALLNLLNITDGLIGDGIAVKFICIFNSPIKNIDSALLRKGRLVTEYEFKELAPEKANKLASVENLSVPEFTRPVTLSEIYHYDGSPESNPDSKIGFNF